MAPLRRKAVVRLGWNAISVTALPLEPLRNTRDTTIFNTDVSQNEDVIV
jgi:hypothetical protein